MTRCNATVTSYGRTCITKRCSVGYVLNSDERMTRAEAATESRIFEIPKERALFPSKAKLRKKELPFHVQKGIQNQVKFTLRYIVNDMSKHIGKYMNDKLKDDDT